MERRAVEVVGCHDAMSAKVIEACGFEAIQISGYGLAMFQVMSSTSFIWTRPTSGLPSNAAARP